MVFIIGVVSSLLLLLCLVGMLIVLFYRRRHSPQKPLADIAVPKKSLYDELLAAPALEGFDRRFLIYFDQLKTVGELGKGVSCKIREPRSLRTCDEGNLSPRGQGARRGGCLQEVTQGRHGG